MPVHMLQILAVLKSPIGDGSHGRGDADRTDAASVESAFRQELYTFVQDNTLQVSAVLEYPTAQCINNGTLRVYMHIRLHKMIAILHVRKAVFEGKRNFSRNIMANVNDIPTKEAYPAIIISSCIKAVEPTISLTAAK